MSWRHPARRAAWQIAAASLHGFRSALDGLGFTEIQTPKLVPSATESGANVFGVDYFGGRAYLAQSPQFYKQTMVGVFERVYETGPVFRAEPHDTARHLAEYVSLDAELGFISSHRDVLAVLRHALAGMTAAVREQAGPAAARLGVTVPEVPTEFPVIHFRDALDLVGASPDEPDLAPAHEQALGQWAARERGSDFLAVEGYPMRKRPFYTHPQPGDERWSNSFDLLFRGVELVTGGQRLHRYAGLPGRHRGPRRGPGRLRRLPGLFRARHAAARRVRDRPGALDQPADRRGKRAGGHPVPPGPASPNAVIPVRAVSRPAGRRAAQGRPGRPRR